VIDSYGGQCLLQRAHVLRASAHTAGYFAARLVRVRTERFEKERHDGCHVIYTNTRHAAPG